MKRNNKKGFTIVELVIVIAVIAILAGVLIPTFAGIVSKANVSKALQEAQNAYKEAYAEAISDGNIASNEEISLKDATGTITWTFKFTDAQNATATKVPDKFGYTVAVEAGIVKVTATKG